MKKILYTIASSLCILACVPMPADAQPTNYTNLFYNGGAVVHVQGGALIHVQGDVNNSSGTFTNNGVLQVEGNLANSGTFNQDNSIANTTSANYERTVRLIGGPEVAGVNASTTNEQQISGTWTGGSSYFYNLVIDKATGSNVVTLATDVEVKDSLIWGASNSRYAATVNNALTGRTTASRVGNGIIRSYNGSTDYELYVSNPSIDAVQGYKAVGTFNYSTSPAAYSSTANDGYVQTRGVNGVTKGFARQVNANGIYTYPVGSPTATYNPVQLNFNFASPGTAYKLVTKFTDNDFSAGAFPNHFDKGSSASPANAIDTSLHPMDYSNNPGYNVFQKTPCQVGTAGNWLIMDKVLKNHGYWSFDFRNTSDVVVSFPAGSYYTIQSFPHGFSEYFTPTAGTDPNKRMLRTSAVSFSGTPSVTNFYDEINSNIYSGSYSDILQYSYAKGTHKSFVNCDDATGIPGGRYTAFSHLAVGTSSVNNNASSLPVELIDLKAEPVENTFIRVSWSTATETDNKGFEVWRSDDGTIFKKVGWVDGNGNSSTIKNYAFNDKNVQPNITYYYKLNQVDVDGRSEETYIVSAKISDGPDFNIGEFQPNPTIGKTKVTIHTTDPINVGVKFYNILGAEVLSHDYQLVAGTNSLDLESDQLAAATYTVSFKVGSTYYSKKLVVVK